MPTTELDNLCGKAKPWKAGGIAHCVVGDVREFATTPSFANNLRVNLIDALDAPQSTLRRKQVFAVLGIGGCHGNVREGAACEAHQNASLQSLSVALERLGATTTLLHHHQPDAVAPAHGCTFGSSRPSSGYWQWAKVRECFGLVEAYELRHCVAFSHVVRSRPDLLLRAPLPPLAAFGDAAVHVGHLGGRGPWWTDDRFAVVPRAHAAAYFLAEQSYFTCRGCATYNEFCGLRLGGLATANATAACEGLPLRSAELPSRSRQVGSECLLGIWLKEHGVPVQKGVLSNLVLSNLAKRQLLRRRGRGRADG